MTREEVLSYALEEYGTEAEYLFADDLDTAVLRRTDSRKWYAIIMSVRPDKLGLPGTENLDIMNVKCDELLLGSLLMQPGFHPAYHMSKGKWVSIALENCPDDELIKYLIDESYSLVAPKIRKRPKNPG